MRKPGEVSAPAVVRRLSAEQHREWLLKSNAPLDYAMKMTSNRAARRKHARSLKKRRTR